MTMPRAILAAFAVWAAAPALAADPPVPLGQDAGGTAVAFMTTGIDYRDPAVAKALARDGEGELIGWDFVDDDNQPFDAGGNGTALAKILAASGRSRLVPVRVDAREPVSLARAVAFVQRTPARLLIIPLASASRDDWLVFEKAARHVSEVLFVASAGDYPAALGLDNMVVVSADKAAKAPVDVRVAPGKATPGEAAALAVVAFLSCDGTLAAPAGREKKVEFLKAARPLPDGGLPLMEPCP